MTDMVRPTVSIVIKALNEERDIAAAIESALAALGDLPGRNHPGGLRVDRPHR